MSRREISSYVYKCDVCGVESEQEDTLLSVCGDDYGISYLSAFGVLIETTDMHFCSLICLCDFISEKVTGDSTQLPRS